MKKKYKQILYLSSIFLICICSSAQAQITFEKVYLDSLQQSGKDVLETSDGYLIAGTTQNSILDDLDIQITKTDFYGNIQWQKSYGEYRPEYPNSMIETSDGNYFVVGYTQSFGNWDFDTYLLKIKPDGDTLFSRVYGGNGNEEGKEIVATSDGNYVIIGATNSANYSDYNMQLMKIDLQGDTLWTKRYGGATTYESARSVKLCPDNGFIIAGKTAPNPTANAKIRLVKTDINGDTLWTKTFTGPNSYEGKSIIANSDGTYVLAADDSSVTFDSDIRIMKLTNSGVISWNKVYGGPDKDIVKMIQPTNDGGYVVAALSRSFWGSNNVDFWILKLNSQGDSTWTRNYGGVKHEHLYSVRQTSDNGYIAIGHNRSVTLGDWENYFLKLNTIGTLVGIREFASNSRLAVYPNPSNGIFNVDLSEETEFTTFTICNYLGQTVFSENLKALRGNKMMTVDMKDKQPGIYFVTLQSSTRTITKKLILN